MALPNSNISVAMVKAELGASTNDVGQLCIHPNINKWSKWKPVRHPSKGDLTSGELASVDFGLGVFSSTNFLDVISSQIIYNLPTGGINSPYRLGDFKGYNHYASPIVKIGGDRTVGSGDFLDIEIDFPPYVEGGITLIEFNGLIGQQYYGIVIKKGASEYIQTAKTSIGGVNSHVISLDLSHPLFKIEGTLEVYHILVNYEISELTILSSLVNDPPVFTALPTSDNSVNVTSITVPRQSTSVEFLKVGVSENILSDITPYIIDNGNRYLTSKQVYVEVKITNSTATAMTISNVTMMAEPTYFNVPSFQINAKLFNYNKVETPSILIPSNGSATVIIGVEDMLNRDGGSVGIAPNNSIFSKISIFNNGNIIGSQFIGFKNAL